MGLSDDVAGIEAFDDAPFDPGLVDATERQTALRGAPPIRFSTPIFKGYASSELNGCSRNAFPAFSVTAGGCALDCDHDPGHHARDAPPRGPRPRAAAGIEGLPAVGRSNRRNEIRCQEYYPVLDRLKRDCPTMRIELHSALLDESRARMMASAGVTRR